MHYIIEISVFRVLKGIRRARVRVFSAQLIRALEFASLEP